jgi:hypothetical protein
MLRVGLPGTLLPVWTVTVPSSAGGAALLLLGGGACGDGGLAAGAAALGALGAAYCVVPLVLMLHVAVRGPGLLYGARLVRAASEHETDSGGRPAFGLDAVGSARGLAATALRLVRVRLRSMTRRDVRWEAVEEGMNAVGGGGCVVRMRAAQSFLLDYRLVWYGTVDAGVLVLLSVLGATSGLGGGDATCLGLAGTVVTLLAAQLVTCAVVRPYTTEFAYVYGVLTLLLSVVSGCGQLWWRRTGEVAALTLSGACDVMISALSLVKLACVDVPGCVKAGWKFDSGDASAVCEGEKVPRPCRLR